MGTEIKTWQVVGKELQPLDSKLREEGRTEPYDLEPWLKSNPDILGPDIIIIGSQIMSKSGRMDLLGIDKTGNVVIVEIKRDQLRRDALAQAIDYASDVAEWGIEKLSEICVEYCEKNLEEAFADAFPDVDPENLKINDAQRILLVGFSVESALERMVQWLSDNFDVNVNAIVLTYVKTESGDELLMKTSIISEETEQERVKKKKKFQIPMSDEPGNYDRDVLRKLLVDYLSRDRVTNQRIRDVLLPALLQKDTLSREELKEKVLEYDQTLDGSKVGYHLSVISVQLGMEKNDFLRQVISYDNHSLGKDNFSLKPEYKGLVREIVEEISQTAQPTD